MIKLFSNRSALIIGETGIYDYSSYPALGFISRKDIRDFVIKRSRFQRFVILYVANPEDYTSRGNLWGRFCRKLNKWTLGSPISIPVLFLEGGGRNLQKVLKAYLYDASGDDQGVTEKQNFFLENMLRNR